MEEEMLASTCWFASAEVRGAAAILIQKFSRSFIEQRRYRNTLASKREDEEKKMFILLKQWKESKQLVSFVCTQTREKLRVKQMMILP